MSRVPENSGILRENNPFLPENVAFCARFLRMRQRPLSPGGLVPVWMAKMAARRAVPTQTERLEQLGREIVQ